MYASAERWLTGYMYGRLINATELDLIVGITLAQDLESSHVGSR